MWIGIAVLAGLILVYGLWAGWTAYRVNEDLSAAVDDAAELRVAIEDGDTEEADRSLAALQEHSRAAADSTDGPTWWVLERLPSLGDDAEGVAVVSRTVADLSEDGIEPLVEASADLESLAPSGGRIDPQVVVDLQVPVAQAHESFAAAEEQLAGEDPSGYVERLKSKYRDLAGQVSDAASALAAADTAVQVLPDMLGVDGARDYLMVFQNNAEARATGGLPGAVSIIRADDGAVRMTRQVAGNSFARIDEPVLPLTAGEEAVYSEVLGTFFLNANLQPDFPRAADLWKARWEQEHPERLDGVLSVDAVAMSYLLGATGPVEVDGVTLTEKNAVDVLLHEAYLQFPDPADQDRFFRAVASTVFDRVAQGADSPRDLLAALGRGVEEHRIYVRDFDPAVQEHLAGTGIAGELATAAASMPQVGVYLADATGSKMSYYLRYDVDVSSTYCNADAQGLTGHIRLGSEAPIDGGQTLPAYVTGGGAAGTKPGDQSVLIYIFGPVDGSVSAVAFNGKPIRGFPAVDFDGRSVVATVVNLTPGQEADLTWRMKSGPGQDGDTRVSVTPSSLPGDAWSSARSSCG